MQAHGFRYYFTPLSAVLFTFPSRYWSTIGLSGVFSLAGWSRLIHAGFLVSRATPDLPCRKGSYGYGAVTRVAGVFHRLFSFYLPCVMGVLYPDMAVTISVWARPSSIASTGGFTVVFSSSGYLDVSVHRVRSYYKVPYLLYGGSPHSDIPGSKPVCGSPGLFAAYRVFRRFLKPRHPPSALVYFLYSFTRT